MISAAVACEFGMTLRGCLCCPSFSVGELKTSLKYMKGRTKCFEAWGAAYYLVASASMVTSSESGEAYRRRIPLLTRDCE